MGVKVGVPKKSDGKRELWVHLSQKYAEQARKMNSFFNNSATIMPPVPPYPFDKKCVEFDEPYVGWELIRQIRVDTTNQPRTEAVGTSPGGKTLYKIIAFMVMLHIETRLMSASHPKDVICKAFPKEHLQFSFRVPAAAAVIEFPIVAARYCNYLLGCQARTDLKDSAGCKIVSEVVYQHAFIEIPPPTRQYGGVWLDDADEIPKMPFSDRSLHSGSGEEPREETNSLFAVQGVTTTADINVYDPIKEKGVSFVDGYEQSGEGNVYRTQAAPPHCKGDPTIVDDLPKEGEETGGILRNIPGRPPWIGGDAKTPAEWAGARYAGIAPTPDWEADVLYDEPSAFDFEDR